MILDKFETGLAFVSKLAVIGLMLIVTLDTIMGQFFNSRIQGASAISSDIFMVIIIYFAMSYCYTSDGHIRISFLRDKLSPKIQSVTEIIFNVLAITFWAFVFFQFFPKVLAGLEKGITLNIAFVVPRVIPNIIIIIGVTALILRLSFTIYQLIGSLKQPANEG